jgi:transposase-like protein
MLDYPNDQSEFETLFATEEACREYLATIRWPSGFACPGCKNEQVWQLPNGIMACQQCRRKTSVTAGTLFHDTHYPLHVWFQAIWYVVGQKYGSSALGLQRLLGLGSYHTAWAWLHRLRRAMVRPGRDRLDGTVEVDETYWGGAKVGKRGRGAAGKTLIFVAVAYDEKKLQRIRLLCIPDVSGSTLLEAVSQSVVPGSMVDTDGWCGYNGLNAAGYIHRNVRTTTGDDDDLLPRVHLVVSLLKRWLMGTHQGGVQASHLDYYLDEFTFRFNRRSSHTRGLLFRRILENAVQLEPLRESDLHAK